MGAFGHHFAAIAGAGPLIGPVLAAQYGYMPGALWILIGAVFAGAVQDYIILYASVRNSGESISKIAERYLGPGGGLVHGVRGAVHHNRGAGGPGDGGGERAHGERLGSLHHRLQHPDCVSDGPVDV